MIKLDERGHQCPLPVINTKKVIEKSPKGEVISVLVDNIIAVQNLEKLAAKKGCEFKYVQNDPANYEATFVVAEDGAAATENAADTLVVTDCGGPKKTVVVISSNQMGNGDEALGKLLMKSFIFALTQADTLPDQIIFYNSGAYLTCEDSIALEDLKALAAAGVKINTCGTCLNHYKLSEKLAIGEVSNMYDIVTAQNEADKVIRP